MKVIVSFSGGKDSQACLIQACREFGAKNIEAVFCDTGWEHELTYQHIVNVTGSLGVKLVVLTRAEAGGFVGLCQKTKLFPDTKHRICTVQLKIKPMIDYVLTQEDDLVIIQGIRAAESKARAKMPCSAHYFQDYLANSDGKRLYRKTDVIQWCKEHSATVERPVIGMGAQEIIDFILAAGQEPNPLYRKGAARVGCYPCIFSRLSEIKAMSYDTAYVQRVIDLEDTVNSLKEANAAPSSFFSKGKIPNRYCIKYGNGIPAFEDVIRYVRRDDAQLDLFETEEVSSCMSIYHGLCE